MTALVYTVGAALITSVSSLGALSASSVIITIGTVSSSVTHFDLFFIEGSQI